MATLKSTQVATSVPAKAIHAGMVSVKATYTATAAISAGDVIQMVMIPSGATIHSVRVSGNPCKQSTNIIGDGNNTSRYLASASAAPSDAITVCTAAAGHGYTYTADDTIDNSLTTATSGSASGSVTLDVTYSMDG